MATSAVFWASTLGPRWLVRRAAFLMTNSPHKLGNLEPAVVANRFNVRLENQNWIQRLRKSEPRPLPFATVLRLVHPHTQAVVHVLATTSKTLPSQITTLFTAMEPEAIVLTDPEIPTITETHSPLRHVPLSNDHLQLLDFRQVEAKVRRLPASNGPIAVALRTARDDGIPVALVGSHRPATLPSALLERLVQRALLLPLHLVPYDPLLGTALNGEISRRVVQRLQDAAQTLRRVVCVVPLECVPLIHTLWNASSQFPATEAPPNALVPDSGRSTALVMRFASELEGSSSPAWQRVAEITEGADLTTQVVLHWLRQSGDPCQSPLVRRRIIPGGEAVLEWNERPAADEFNAELHRLQGMLQHGPDSYDENLIVGAWRNVLPVFLNSMLLARGKAPLDYPGLQALCMPSPEFEPHHD